jgi:3-hydroxyisobutyrate dehydrogenase
MLPAGEHVREAYLGRGSILESCPGGALLVDCSTIAPAVARDVAGQARARGLGMLDAPVSGGTAGAEAGTLTFMVGGSEGDLARAGPLLGHMGKNVFHAGPSGSGQAVKMCNNMMLGIQMAGACEALRLGIAHGLEPARLTEIMCKSSGRNWALEVYNPCPGVLPGAPASRGYAGGFSTDLMLKDLTLAAEGAESTGTPTPLGRMARDLYRLHRDGGHGGRDFSSLFEDAAASAALLERLGDRL